MKLLLLLVVFVTLKCVYSYQIPNFDNFLQHRYQVQSSKSRPATNDFSFRQLLNSKNVGNDYEELSAENAADDDDEDDEDPFSARYGSNSEEFNDITNNIQNDDDDDTDVENGDDEGSTEIKADVRQEETESHSSLVAGHQYVSGGAGEGKQHLQPDGHVPNKDEIKTDADLPAYCEPPNPCPFGYKGSDECDSTHHFSEFTADFSKAYQERQFCMCDDDHNECKKSPGSASRGKQIDQINDLIQTFKSGSNIKKLSPVVAKKSPRIRRDISKLRAAGHLVHPSDRLVRVAKKKTA